MLVNLNDVELDFDFYDAEQAPAYANGAQKVADALAEMEGKTAIEDIAAGYKKIAKATSEMLDAIFGAGTGEKVLKGKESAYQSIEILDSLARSIDEQNKVIGEFRAKYSPARLAKKGSKS